MKPRNAPQGQKLMAVPGAAFPRYHREVARRFGMLRLAGWHGAEAVLAAFGKATAPPKIIRA